jgi:hypothetical protein
MKIGSKSWYRTWQVEYILDTRKAKGKQSEARLDNECPRTD